MDEELLRRRGTQVAQSLNMIAELPHYVDDKAFPVGLRVAAIDAFFVHLRLVIEFLIKPAEARAIRRHDYTSNFHMNAALRGRLNDGYEFASRHVAHLNIERVPTDQAPIVEYVDATRLRGRAVDAFIAMGALVQHLVSTGSVFAGDFGSWLKQADDVAQRRPGGPAAE